MGKAKDGSGAFRFGSSNAGADPCCGYEKVDMCDLPVQNEALRAFDIIYKDSAPDPLPKGFLGRPSFKDRL